MNQVVLITGAGRGLGRAMADAFAEDGAGLVLNDIDPGPLAKAAQELRARGADVLAVPGDVSVRAEVEALLDQALSYFGDLHVAVNNAGAISSAPVWECDEEEWDRTVAVNLKGTFLCSQAEARHFIRAGRGSIINLGSINGKVARLNNSAYCAAKAAISHFTRVLALELAPYGVRANTLSPGSSGGAMASAHYPAQEAEAKLLHGDLETWRLGVPLRRLCTPQDVAAAAVFLASEAAQHITGHELFVDGGQSTV